MRPEAAGRVTSRPTQGTLGMPDSPCVHGGKAPDKPGRAGPQMLGLLQGPPDHRCGFRRQGGYLLRGRGMVVSEALPSLAVPCSPGA